MSRSAESAGNRHRGGNRRRDAHCNEGAADGTPLRLGQGVSDQKADAGGKRGTRAKDETEFRHIQYQGPHLVVLPSYRCMHKRHRTEGSADAQKARASRFTGAATGLAYSAVLCTLLTSVLRIHTGRRLTTRSCTRLSRNCDPLRLTVESANDGARAQGAPREVHADDARPPRRLDERWYRYLAA